MKKILFATAIMLAANSGQAQVVAPRAKLPPLTPMPVKPVPALPVAQPVAGPTAIVPPAAPPPGVYRLEILSGGYVTTDPGGGLVTPHLAAASDVGSAATFRIIPDPRYGFAIQFGDGGLCPTAADNVVIGHRRVDLLGCRTGGWSITPSSYRDTYEIGGVDGAGVRNCWELRGSPGNPRGGDMLIVECNSSPQQRFRLILLQRL